MPKKPFLSISQQAVDHLRKEILHGRWSQTMPGRQRLAEELGLNEKTVEIALEQLEKEGLLENQGPGRRRRIVSNMKLEPTALRVAYLEHSPEDKGEAYMISLTHQLQDAGHAPFYADKTLAELGMKPSRVARLVKQTEADAWLVCSGARGILEWFAANEIPCFALFGPMDDLPIPGTKPDRVKSQTEATRALLSLGHRRISFLCRHQNRHPLPAIGLRAYLSELETAGIETGAFHLPEWEESAEGLMRILDSLCDGPTPVTALFLDEPFLYHAAHHHLCKRGLRIPEDISLICTDGHQTFRWCRPSVAHIEWDTRPIVRRILRWADNIAKGRSDQRQSFTKSSFVPGGTIGPVNKRR